MTKLPWHISGKLHVQGASRFIGEEAKPEGMLYAGFLFSPVAHAWLISLDTAKALALPGVSAILTAKDIPGENQIGHVIRDEPLFPTERIMYIGQPLAMVLSPYPRIARKAVKLIEFQYEQSKPLLDIEEADAKGEWYIHERRIECGDVQKALSEAENVLQGTIETSAQEHICLETQRCRAVPGEDGQIFLYSATQSTMEVQEVVAHLLNLPAHKIIVDVPRLGGAFGGKERAATIWACLAALGTYCTGRAVQVILNREEDILATGKRHPFLSRYRVGFDSTGKISAYDVELLSNGGAYADLSVAILERAMFHADNAYHLPNARIRGRACRTNLPPNTAFRGFGAPQGIFVIESVMEQIAEHLNLDALEVRKANVYREGDAAPYGQPVLEATGLALFRRLEAMAGYQALRHQVRQFNAQHELKKQGIGIVPVKFGVSFTTALLNQGSALVWVYIDGSISVTTCGVEMGQQVSTKVALVVSRILGVTLDKIRVESSNTQRVGNASPTAASTGSDINGNAARNAAEQIRTNLLPVAQKLLAAKLGREINPSDIVFADSFVFDKTIAQEKTEFEQVVREAYNQRIPLAAYGFYQTPGVWFDREKGYGNPFYYYVHGCALVRAEVDLLSGEHLLHNVFIVHENGQSLHPGIDMGQIIGGFIQCAGWCTMEDIPYDQKGNYQARSLSTYKIPTIRDLPRNLKVDLLPSASKFASILGSKAIGEPPFIYGEAVFFAIRSALRAANPTAELSFPATPENILKAIR